MNFRVDHRTCYRYSAPVFLEPQVIRLRPRDDASQRLCAFALKLDPAPCGLSEGLDAEGNCVLHAWFEGQTESFCVASSFEVETCRDNPFDFLMAEPGVARLPATYAEGEDLRRWIGDIEADSAPVAALGAALAEAAGGETLPFLMRLCQEIPRRCRLTHRERGDPRPAAATLAAGEGACRDLAVLFIEVCRLQGLAARFVSGYQQGGDEKKIRHLHAWCEVYLPGGGWRGFDPSGGLAVADGHVAVAAACRPALAAPVSGSVRGAATSSIEVSLEIEHHG